jgi:two-component system response regulator YesN
MWFNSHRNCYVRDLSLEEVAASINLVPAYFSRLFSQITGASFINYLTDLRIQRAKELLQGTDDQIKAISETVGYSNIYYFSRVFKNKTGLTPVEYRRQTRAKI